MTDHISTGTPITGTQTQLEKVCASIENLEAMLDANALSMSEDGQSVTFASPEHARKRLRELKDLKSKLQTADDGIARRKRRPLVNRVRLNSDG